MAAVASSKPFVPPFLAKLGLKPGEWMYHSKPTVRNLMCPSRPLKVRIFGCLMLQSFGYETDLAVVMSKAEHPGSPPKTEPITPRGISSMLNKATVEAFKESKIPLNDEQRAGLHIAKQDMRRALAEMEDDGVIMRVRVNSHWKDLKGKSLGEALESEAVTPLADLPEGERKKVTYSIAVFLHARPKPARNLRETVGIKRLLSDDNSFNGNNGPFLQLLFSFAPELRADPALAAEVANRHDVQVQVGEYQRILAEAKEKLRTFLQTALHPEIPHADEGRQAGIPPPERDRASRSAPPQSPPAVLDPEVHTVLEVMRRFSGADDHAAKRLIQDCRKNAPACTTVQICDAVVEKGRLARSKENPTGFLIVCVPRLFEGSAYQIRQAAGEEVLVGTYSGEVRRKQPTPAPSTTEMAERLRAFRQSGGSS
jgi:hypothetical protein